MVGEDTGEYRISELLITNQRLYNFRLIARKNLMTVNIYKFSQEDELLWENIEDLTNQQKYGAAIELIQERLEKPIDITIPNDALLKAKLAGFLIDIGSEGQIERPIKNAIDIYNKNKNTFGKFIHKSSIEYNLGNAKSGLFRIQKIDPTFKFNPKNIGMLTETKNHYWRAYKLLPKDDIEFRKQLLTNLANALDASCRVVEALQYYDQVISEDPEFPQANASRGEALIWLNHICGSYSVNQIWQAMNNFAIAAKSKNVPDWYIRQWEAKRDRLQNKLEKHGCTEKDIEHDIELTRTEADSHSDYRKFCLKHSLCLSEHSLYCNCIGADRDNLTIPKTSGPIGGDDVPRMELRLNRIKSEYAIARLLFYESSEINQKKWEPYNKEVSFTELYEDEAVGHRPEMLRTSFRLCFGILDKIAHAVSELFDLSDPDEPLAFERFWRPRGKGLSKKQKGRWEKINQIENFPLLALYSQATDLNSQAGEWGNFKDWRNALEHESLILTQSSDKPLDIYGALASSPRILKVNYTEFREKTLHLLQLTRSAIFNFVFCVRIEGEKDLTGQGVSITLSPKNELT